MSPVSYISGTLDNDVDGTTGRGTIFWMTVTDGANVHRYEWGLIDQLEGRFDPYEILRPFKEASQNARIEAEQQLAADKRKELDARASNVKRDPIIIAAIEEVIAANPKSVAQYKSGKEKAINSLIGQVIAKTKADAFVIKQLMKITLDNQK